MSYAGGHEVDALGWTRAPRGGTECANFDARLDALIDQVTAHGKRACKRNLATLDEVGAAGIGAQFDLLEAAGVGALGNAVEFGLGGFVDLSGIHGEQDR